MNSSVELREIWEASRPMLVRTYAGTKNIPYLARVYEDTINIAWHALSFWWFNKLDERGEYDLYTNLIQHFKTLKVIAATNKPFEANVSHHFAFRGASDITYVVSAYLAAKAAKKNGVKTFVLQNMLNTPRLTWGVQDLAKSRVMLDLVRSLEDQNFRVILQPRAGLDYFKSDLLEAKIQLAAVSALMDDIEPNNEFSPQIIHVVSYSEASHLATPEIIDESIRITQYSLKKYRELRRTGKVIDMTNNSDVNERYEDLMSGAKKVIECIEKNILDTYTPEGFYKIFSAGFLAVPYLWDQSDEFINARNWKTKPIRGSIKLVDEHNKEMKMENMLEIALHNLIEAERHLNSKILKSQYLRS